MRTFTRRAPSDVTLPHPWGRLTATQAQALKLGYHPGSGRPLAKKKTRTCGGCDHLVSAYGGYLKCDEGTRRITNGPATDVQKGWPACVAWKRLGT